jgi:putative chitinase
MCLVAAVGQGCPNSRADVKTLQILLNLNASRFNLAAPLATDGSVGPKTLDALAAFQTSVVGLAAPDRKVAPGSATLTALAAGIPAGLGAAQLQGIMVNANQTLITRFFNDLVANMKARQINTPRRQAHFLAQVGHESGELQFTEEIASGEAYEGRVDLGNTHAGDGPRFKGRGLIQLTGRSNYQAYGTAIGVDLVNNDNWLRVSTDPNLAVDVACWFWDRNGLNALADNDDIRGITKKINGGFNGLDDREQKLGRGKFFLGLSG